MVKMGFLTVTHRQCDYVLWLLSNSAKHHSNMQCVPERTWRTKTVFKCSPHKCIIRHLKDQRILHTLIMHVRMNERGASHYFPQSVWTSSRRAKICPPSWAWLHVSPRLSGSLVTFAKFVKKMLIMWRTKRTLTCWRSSWDPLGLIRLFSRKKKPNTTGRDGPETGHAAPNSLFTLLRKSVTWICLISSCN